jgi:hypothetical protein
MGSLKDFSPTLAKVFNTNSIAVYERQRALVREGIFPEPMHGRSPGLLATPDTVAMMLIAHLATDRLRDTNSRVKRFANAKYQRRGEGCPLTGAKTFQSALSAILGDDEKAHAVLSIEVARQRIVGTIAYLKKHSKKSYGDSIFGECDDFPPPFETVAILSGDAIRQIAARLKQEQES